MSNLAANRVVILNEASFNEENDINWKKHELYNSFINDLDSDYRHKLTNEQRIHSSYLSSLKKSKHNYSLFKVYLKIISEIDETVDHLEFKFKINNNNTQNNTNNFEVKSIIDIYYLSGFVQTIVIHNTNKNINNTNIQSPNNPKPNIKQINNTLINQVKKQKAYNEHYGPIYIKHNPNKTNPLHTDIQSPNYNLQNDNDKELNNKMEMDHDDDDEKYGVNKDKNSDIKNQNNTSILWRFYDKKNHFSSIDWPTCMDDTFFSDRPDIVRSNNSLTQFTFVNNNPEWNERRGNYLDEWSDVDDSENNDLSINFRSNNPIPNNIFMYYFEVTVKHNLVQSHNAKFKRCYFGLIPQSKIYFPANNDKKSKNDLQILQNIILNNNYKKE
eukprot:490771_1